MHIHLTVAMKHRIFNDYPDVHKLFLQMVPHTMAEKTFWMRYFRSKTRRENAGGADPAALGSGGTSAGRAAAASGGASNAATGSSSPKAALPPKKRLNAGSICTEAMATAAEQASPKPRPNRLTR